MSAEPLDGYDSADGFEGFSNPERGDADAGPSAPELQVPFRNLDTGEILTLSQLEAALSPHPLLPRPPPLSAAPECCGYLWKRGHTLGQLARRWYVLHPAAGLAYFSSAQESVHSPSSRRVVDLHGARVVAPPEVVHGLMASRPLFALLLLYAADGATEERSREFFAEHPEEQRLWASALTQHLAAVGAAGAPAPPPLGWSASSSSCTEPSTTAAPSDDVPSPPTRAAAHHRNGSTGLRSFFGAAGRAQLAQHAVSRDVDHRQPSGQRDQHGFLLSLAQAAGYAQWSLICAAAERVQLQQWAAHLAECGTPPPPPAALVAAKGGSPWAARQAMPRYKQVKRLVRGGVPQGMRRKLWPELSGAAARWEEQPRLYSDLLAEAARDGCSARDEIEKDLHRTFPNHAAFDQGGEGRDKLRDILTAYALRNHNVGYCQSLNYVAAMLLVALGFDAEASFWMLATFCEDIFPDFYSHSMTGIRIEQTVFASFVREISPQVHAHFAELGVPLEMVSTQWFLCLFVNLLPAATLLRVWDVMLWEGPSVLLRAGAALLHWYRDAVLATTDFHTIAQLVQRLGHDLWHADGLLSTMYNKHRMKSRAQQKIALRHVQKERGQQRQLLEGEEVRDLQARTHFTAAELEALRASVRSRVLEQVGSEGSDVCVRDVHLPLILAQLRRLAPREGRQPWGLAEAVYDIIDARGEGYVRLDKLLLGLSALCLGDEEERLQFTLKAFDRDGDGRLSAAELSRLLCRAYSRCAPLQLMHIDVDEYVRLLLAEMSPTEGKGANQLSFQQFVYLVRTEPVLRQWVPLADDADRAAYEHRAAVVRRAMVRASTASFSRRSSQEDESLREDSSPDERR
ncbi:hypothetical protein AB1Y20_006967 [Prymnesium parvum]|uniref:Uncharacterized protein n=1 Tax=Prymnesium parvum TaxID=97485 RepID=A0AB34J256_PRYPA